MRGQDSPGKAKCEGEVEKQRAGAAVHSGKTPNDTGPDSHHSSECVRVSASRKTFHKLGSNSLEEMKLCVLDVEVLARALAKDVERE